MEPPRDLTETILAGVEPEWRRRSSSRRAWLTAGRVALAVLAVAYAAWAIATVGSTSGVAEVSTDTHVLAPSAQPEYMALIVQTAGLRFAIAIGLALCSWRPSLISGFLLVPTAMTAFLIGFVVRDAVLGWLVPEQLTTLLVLAITVFALGGTWLAGHGYALRAAWRALSAEPN